MFNLKKSGFTLMEIMVVIIVIAVLASVAGPMIGSITDQGRASATKSKISSLKSALMAYKADVGRYPFAGPPKCARNAQAYNDASDRLLGCFEDTNILVNANLGADGMSEDFDITNYTRKWKGPYMQSAPDDFMMDAWGNKIRYSAVDKSVYLQSMGADMIEESIPNMLDDDYVEDMAADDILISVFRTRAAFK
ncbi:MAG: prepilin-type N-terminal cleavage/methylation domain-containing protein [Candidatus Rifleibacteriota bacterium]